MRATARPKGQGCDGASCLGWQVYNYNTMEKIKAWEAHMDYIRYVEVHPTLPNVLR